MTTFDRIETKLREAVAVSPSEDGLLWLDQQVARIVAAAPPARRLGTWRSRTFGRMLLVVAAFLLLAGAVAGAVRLMERTVEPIPGWSTAWERAEILGASQSDAGLTLKLERAYADLNHVMVFVGIEGLGVPRATDGFLIDHLSIHDAMLRDPAGRMPIEMTGVDAAEAGLGVSVRSFQFDPGPTLAGTYELTITTISYGADGPACVSPCSEDLISGIWRFEFALPSPAGTVVSSDAADTNEGATLRLTELRVTPTMITARIAMYVGESPVAWWGFIPSDDDLRHGGERFGFWSGRHVLDVEPFEEGPAMAFSTNAGSDDAAGTWEIVIPELDYAMRNGEPPIHLTGPWKLLVNVP